MAEKIAQRVAFGETLVELGEKNTNIVVLDGDLSPSSRVDMFAHAHPERFYQMGIAEQNMMGVAAGMSTLGLIPFVVSFACFTAKRALDQIRIVIAQPKLNVKLVGAYSGILTGKTGKTHQSVQDIAIFRSMPNVITIAPVDGIEVRQAVRAAAEYEGPVYLRLTRDPCPVVLGGDYNFTIGKGVLLKTGSDVTLIGTGQQSQRCLEAANLLEADGISAQVLHLPTIKPIDEEAVLEACIKTGRVVTAEDHNIIGGLGGAVAELLGERHPLPINRVGLNDVYCESGPNDHLIEKYGLTPAHVAAAARKLLEG